MMDAEKVEKVCEWLERCTSFDSVDNMYQLFTEALSVIRELKAENERLRQEKADAVKRIEQCRLNCISGEKDCDSALDREGKEINRAKAYAYQWVLNIINKPTK